MDDNRDSHSIRLKVFRDEAPELFAMLEQLPSGKYTKRTALIRILELGFQAANGQHGVRRAGVRPVAAPVTIAPVSDSSQLAGGADRMPEVRIDESDLETLFG